MHHHLVASSRDPFPRNMILPSTDYFGGPPIADYEGSLSDPTGPLGKTW